jgi:hypothetical protein
MLALRLWQVAIDRTQNFDDSLNRMKLEDGVEGVQELKASWDDVSEVFEDPLRKHPHVVVECPPPGECEWIAAAAAILISSSINSPVPISTTMSATNWLVP